VSLILGTAHDDFGSDQALAAAQGLVAADDPMGHIQWASFPQQPPHLFPGQADIFVHVLREDVEKEVKSSARTEAAVLTRIGLHYFPFLAERTPLEGSSPFATSPTEKVTTPRTMAGVFRPVVAFLVPR
jgi:hypothetical protein